MRVRHVITVHINRKPCMMSPMTSSHLTLGDLERSNSRSLGFRRAELGHKLVLNINRKAYMASSIASSHLTWSDLERSNSRSLRLPTPFIL